MKLLIAFDHAVIKFQIQLNRNTKIDISATNIFSIDKWIKQRHLKKKKFSMIKCGDFIEHFCTSVVLKK